MFCDFEAGIQSWPFAKYRQNKLVRNLCCWGTKWSRKLTNTKSGEKNVSMKSKNKLLRSINHASQSVYIMIDGKRIQTDMKKPSLSSLQNLIIYNTFKTISSITSLYNRHGLRRWKLHIIILICSDKGIGCHAIILLIRIDVHRLLI